MNEALQALEIKVENGGATPQGKFFAKDWNTLVEAVKQLDLAEFDEAALNKYLKDNGYITSDDIPSTDLSDLVTLSTEQTIPGPKNFTGELKVNGQPLIYNAELGVWELTGDLLVTGNVAWFASIKGFKPSTIMDAVQVDGETIVKNELGQLKVIGGGSGGSGGGLTVSDLSNYLTTNKYTKQSDVETLISTALTPYALTAAIPTNNNQLSNGAGYITAAALNGYAKTTDIPSLAGYATEQWVTNKGYITSSALNGYATQSWVEGKKYLTGITSSQVTTALGYTPYNSSNPDKYIKGIDYDMVIAALGYTPYSSTNPMGYLTISSLLGYATEQWVGDNYLASSNFSKANIKSTLGISDWALAGTKPSYTAAEVGALSTSGGALSGSITIGAFTSFGVSGGNFYLGSPEYPLLIRHSGTATINGDTIIHSGNIGQQSVDYANSAGLANRTEVFETLAYNTPDFDLNTGCLGGGLVYNYGSSSYWKNAPSGLLYGIVLTIASHRESGLQGQLAWDINHGSTTDGTRNLWWRANGGSFVNSKWHQIAFTDSNVASATKLQTPRTIWGQSFDGTGNVVGALSSVSYLTFIDTESGIYQGNRFSGAMTKDGVLISGDLISLFGGNVAVGGTTADAKLHVYGGVRIKDDVIISAADDYGSYWSRGFVFLVNGAQSGGVYGFGAGKALSEIVITASGGRASEKGLKLLSDGTNVLGGDTTINGNLLVNGNVSWITQSQRSLKHITSEQGLSLAQLERIKPIKFYWKDGRDAALHVGGVADVFDEVLPEVVARNKGVLCLNYVDAAFYVGASLIAPVLDHERRIAQLERENTELKKKLNQLAA